MSNRTGAYQPKTRLFVDTPALRPGMGVVLNAKQTHYLKAVLRMEAGARLLLFNGRDGEWQARVERLAKKDGLVQVEQQSQAQERVPDLWLCFAPIKRDRVDYLVEKATELGVAHLRPVITQRTIAERVNIARLRAHAVEAAEQCGRTHVPDIAEPLRLDQLLGDWPAARRLMFCDEMRQGPAASQALAQADSQPAAKPLAIRTGPEGGFALGERQARAAHQAAVPVHLGPRILRADTAALAAIALWQAVLGDWA